MVPVVTVPVPATLEDIRVERSGDIFPSARLEGLRTALVLFAAGFYGRQDAFWIAEAGLRATCVDIDREKIQHMATLYPKGWSFVCDDVFEYVKTAESWRLRWDIVTVDCKSDLFDNASRMVDTWCDRAKRIVILGSDGLSLIVPPNDWTVVDVIHRSDHEGGVYWTVMERA